MQLFLNTNALALYLFGLLRMASYVSDHRLNTLVFFATVGFGFFTSSFFRTQTYAPSRNMWLSSCLFFSVIPITRLTAIYGAPSLLFLFAFLWSVCAHFFWTHSFRRHNLWLALQLFFFGLLAMALEKRGINSTQLGYVLGITGMALATLFAGRSRLPISGTILTLLIILLFKVYPGNFTQEVFDTPKARLSFVKQYGTEESISLYVNGYPHYISQTGPSYHACMSQFALTILSKNRKTLEKALILFGADGILARNILSVKSVKDVTIVDSNFSLANLAREHEFLRSYNLDALSNTKTKVLIRPVYQWVVNQNLNYDVILGDLPRVEKESDTIYFTKQFLKALSHHPNSLIALSMQSDLPRNMSDTFNFNTRFQTDYFSDTFAHRQFVLIYPKSWLPLDVGFRDSQVYLTKRCTRNSKHSEESTYDLRDLITGRYGGEERVSKLLSQNVKRLSLPR